MSEAGLLSSMYPHFSEAQAVGILTEAVLLDTPYVKTFF